MQLAPAYRFVRAELRGKEAFMSNSFLNWSSRTAIEGRITERRHPQNWREPTMPGDYHLPFAKADAHAKAVRWLWQAFLI